MKQLFLLTATFAPLPPPMFRRSIVLIPRLEKLKPVLIRRRQLKQHRWMPVLKSVDKNSTEQTVFVRKLSPVSGR